MTPEKVSVLSNVCPRCHQGQVFRHFFSLRKSCERCGLVFEKEEGYFFGPMILSYFATLLVALPVLLVAVFKLEAEFAPAMLATAAVITLVGPIFYRYSKLIWLHLETGFDKGMKAEQERARKLADDRRQP